MINSSSTIIKRITEFILIKVELLKLRVIAYSSRVLANMFSLVFLVIISLFFLFFLSFGLGFLLNQVLDSLFLGHLIIAGFYFLLIIILFLLIKTRKIQGWVENLLLNMLEKENGSKKD